MGYFHFTLSDKYHAIQRTIVINGTRLSLSTIPDNFIIQFSRLPLKVICFAHPYLRILESNTFYALFKNSKGFDAFVIFNKTLFILEVTTATEKPTILSKLACSLTQMVQDNLIQIERVERRQQEEIRNEDRFQKCERSTPVKVDSIAFAIVYPRSYLHRLSCSTMRHYPIIDWQTIVQTEYT